MKKTVLFCTMLGLLAACQPAGSPTTSTSQSPSNVKIGTPYVINGKKYYPEYNAYYDKVGIASWYGPGFHGKYTANGEVFNQNDLTAAHPTLPMPSLVRVTNLHNGKHAIIRVNDRGPFKDNRIIDLSKKSAQRLGVTGLAKVRVQFLQRETEEYMAALKAGRPFDMVAYNDRPPEAKIVENTRYSSFSGEATNTPAAPVVTVQTQENQPIVTAQTEPPAQQPMADEEKFAYEDEVMEDEFAQADTFEEPAEEVQTAYQDEVAQPLAPPPQLAPSAGQAATYGEFTIQAGVFSSEDNARKLTDKLSDIARASMEMMESAGKTLWRVQVGSFNNRKDAEQHLASVRELGNVPDARIVRR